MSASSKVPLASLSSGGGLESGAIAHVNFRVRCETLGHGEEVFLVQAGDDKRQKVSATHGPGLNAGKTA